MVPALCTLESVNLTALQVVMMHASSLCTRVPCADGANVPSSLCCHDAGIIGLSSYLPLPQLTKDLSLSPAALKTPVFLSRYARLRMQPRTRVA